MDGNMKSRIRPYKALVFTVAAMTAVVVFGLMRMGMERACGPCADSAVSWAAVSLASLSVISTTQLLWYLYVERRP